jgi:UPF0716 protein FxsA
VFPLLVVLFLLLPLAELWVIVSVADGIGIGYTIVLLLAISVAGAWLVKAQGFGALRRIQQTLNRGSMPTSELADGALIVLAGALLLTPGFITDTVGFLLLIPPSRAIVRKALISRYRSRLRIVTTTPGSGRRSGADVVDVDGREPGAAPPFGGPPALEP